MYDLIIENARICDGTGTQSFYGNVAVKDGLIAAVGKGNGEAAQKKIKADGLALAPGFIDPHTHYDAQVAWDPPGDLLLLARHYHGGDGQLRRGRCPGSAQRPRYCHVGPGQCRGNPVRGHGAGH